MSIELSSFTCFSLSHNHAYDVGTSYRTQFDAYGELVSGYSPYERLRRQEGMSVRTAGQRFGVHVSDSAPE